ncbi:MAG TPA: hypothetical protein PLD23_08285 [Armatimonadota bacterium]|nr:hypothetical protein [Armatimonadota bacterium]
MSARWGVLLVFVALGGPTLGQGEEAPVVHGPAWFDRGATYYSAFEGGLDAPEVNRAEAVLVAQGTDEARPVVTAGAGFIGQGLHIRDGQAPLVLRSGVFSPHRPVTLSFWWALPYDLTIEGAYTLFSLTGRGYIALFCRGQGEWCALQRPAGVFQVYYFEDIRNINGIYDFDLLGHTDLRAGVWHHTAVVFRRASTIQVYTDGDLSCEYTVMGGVFREVHELATLTLGGPLYLDELAVLDRAIDAPAVAEYVQGMRQLRGYLRPAE